MFRNPAKASSPEGREGVNIAERAGRFPSPAMAAPSPAGNDTLDVIPSEP
jgi:hypothetical protein